MSALRNLSDRDLRFDFSEDSSKTSSSSDIDFDISRGKSGIINLDSRRGRPAWEREVLSLLCEYTQLPPDWDSYGGKPLRLDTGMFALQILSGVMSDSMPTPSVVPTSSGGVQFEWHQNGLDIELYVAAPFDCELTVFDHTVDAPEQVFLLSTELSPLREHVRRLVEFNRHLNVQANVG